MASPLYNVYFHYYIGINTKSRRLAGLDQD